MPERFQQSFYNPDDPNYRENQSFENKEGKTFDQSASALRDDSQNASTNDASKSSGSIKSTDQRDRINKALENPNYSGKAREMLENQKQELEGGGNFDSPGKPEGKIDSSSNNTEPVSSTPVSASDRAQADIKSLRGEHGQDGATKSDAQSKYDQFKSEQLQGDRSKSVQQSDNTPMPPEPSDSNPSQGARGNPNPYPHIAEVNGKMEPGNTIGSKNQELTNKYNNILKPNSEVESGTFDNNQSKERDQDNTVPALDNSNLTDDTKESQLQGGYGQNSDSASNAQNSDSAGDAQSKYDNFKAKQLGGNYGQDGDSDGGGEANSQAVSEASSGGDSGGSSGGGGEVDYA